MIIIRGGGDLATGVVQKFHRCGFKTLVLESPKPTAIRRTVSICEAVYDLESSVEDIYCKKIESLDLIDECFENNIVPLIVDEKGESIKKLKPKAVIDCIIAKKNLGTNKNMADITIALGPGFTAGKDVDVVIETMRGHNLGRLIFEGTALANTGIPGEVGGKSFERVIHSPNDGVVKYIKKIGDIVNDDEIIFYVGDTPVKSPFKGLLRGLIRNNFYVKKGLKIADVDTRTDIDYKTISDKARCLGGAVLEAYLILSNK